MVLGAQGAQIAEGANGSPGSPINWEPMEPIELWSPVTLEAQGANYPPREPTRLWNSQGIFDTLDEMKKGVERAFQKGNML